MESAREGVARLGTLYPYCDDARIFLMVVENQYLPWRPLRRRQGGRATLLTYSRAHTAVNEHGSANRWHDHCFIDCGHCFVAMATSVPAALLSGWGSGLDDRARLCNSVQKRDAV